MTVRQSQQSSIWSSNKEAKRELGVYIDTKRLNFQPTTTYLGVKLDRTLSYWQHLTGLRDKVVARSALIRKLVGAGWRASPSTLRSSAMTFVYASAEYCAPTWSRSRHIRSRHMSLNCTLRIITGYLQPTPIEQLPVLGIPPAELRRRAASLALARRVMDPDYLHHPITREETQNKIKSRRLFATIGFLKSCLGILSRLVLSGPSACFHSERSVIQTNKQVVSDSSASSQRFNYFFWFFGITRKKASQQVPRDLFLLIVWFHTQEECHPLIGLYLSLPKHNTLLLSINRLKKRVNISYKNDLNLPYINPIVS